MLEPAGREPSVSTFSEFRIVRALTTMGDGANPRSGSIMFLMGSRSSPRDPFHPAFLRGVDDRAELVRRLRLIQPRERLLLFLWYVAGWPVPSIAAHLGVSRVHCYRLRNASLRRMAEGYAVDGEESAVVPEA